MKYEIRPSWIMNGYYHGTFKYSYPFFKDMAPNPHRKLYNGLNTVTQAEVYL
jgi:hypothetical protein